MDGAREIGTGERDGGVQFDAQRKRRLVTAVARAIVDATEELTALDAAIGDGDHGHNMKRGFEAVLEDVDALSAMRLPDLVKTVGTRLVMKIGGASGSSLASARNNVP
jgi:dihydroxyacetone kinase-like protein